jgi:hypothetical protein
MGAQGTLPASQAAAEGTITIQAVQGTEGGPQIGQEDAVVDLVRPDDANSMSQPQRISVQLDKQGAGLLEHLPLQPPFQPRVAVKHGGVWFDAVGKPMDSANPSQKITVTVYETTTQTPKWEIQRRNLRLLPSPDGLDVTEMLELYNPTDRAWVGAADAKGKLSWQVLPLPAEAKYVIPSDGLSVLGGKLVSLVPLNPGPTLVTVTYKVPVKDGQASLDLEAPVPVTTTTIFLPEDNTTLQGKGVQPAGMVNMEAPMRTFDAPALEAGQHLLLTVGNLGKEAEPSAADAAPSSSALPRTLAAVGGGVILVFCIVLLVIRPGKKANAASSGLPHK